MSRNVKYEIIEGTGILRGWLFTFEQGEKVEVVAQRNHRIVEDPGLEHECFKPFEFKNGIATLTLMEAKKLKAVIAGLQKSLTVSHSSYPERTQSSGTAWRRSS